MKLGANFALNIGWKNNNVPKLDVFVPNTKRNQLVQKNIISTAVANPQHKGSAHNSNSLKEG